MISEMKKIFSVIISFFILFTSITCVFAENPLEAPNNKFGIHITSENDLVDASKLVNSSGGDWGYVTFVITESERNHDRWQQVFDQMRRLHLIPIVRIASKPEGETWTIPKHEEIDSWVSFLNSLNWVTKNRYIIVSNEPNHAKEWGGKLDPAGYALYLKEFSTKVKEASPDFFILPAGLDGSSNNSRDTMEETRFLNLMVKAEPDIFDYIDGWNSHPYPNPSTYYYDTELSYLKNLGVTKNLPVFITETGFSSEVYKEEEISEKFINAYKNTWNDPRVVAITPFILNYPQPPFGKYSWKKENGSFYKHYSEVQKLEKIAGNPIQIISGQILLAIAQPIMIPGTNYFGIVLAKNNGQSIWNSKTIFVTSDYDDNYAKGNSFLDTEPGKIALIFFKAEAPKNVGLYSNSIFLKSINGARVTNSFPIEAVLVNMDKMQLNSFFAKIASYLQSSLN